MGMKEKERRGTTQERNDPQTDKTKLKTHRKQNSNDESNKQPKTKTKNTEGETTTDPYFLIGKKTPHPLPRKSIWCKLRRPAKYKKGREEK